MSIDHEIGKCGAIGGVKQLRASLPDRSAYQPPGYVAALAPASPDLGAASVPEGSLRAGAEASSRSGVSFATAYEQSSTASMPTCFHHARSSRTR